MKISKVIFYNHFGAGDIFESREFVKDWAEKLPGAEYYYAHGKNKKIIMDIPYIKSIAIDSTMSPMDAVKVVDDTLYVNTWIGRDSRYVLPGIGCTVEMLYKMHNDMMSSIGIGRLSKWNVFDYIPSIDYRHYELVSNVNKWLFNHGGRRNILICNGLVQSSQAENFDFADIIISVAREYPEHNFIITEKIDHNESNIYDTYDIIMDEDGFDLNEISYLSMFCDTIVGRNSGPHVFSQVKENWMNPEKAILSFTYKKSGSHFVYSDALPARKFWSPATRAEDVVNVIKEVIDR